MKRLTRRGMATLDAVLVTATCVPIAAALYWLFEEGLETYLLVVGTAVGWPLM